MLIVANYHTARKFCGVKFLRKLIRLSFRNFIFVDSGPIAIINDVNIVLRIKMWTSIMAYGSTPYVGGKKRSH